MSKRLCLQSPLGSLLPIHMKMYLGVLLGYFLALVAQRHQTGHVLPWPPRQFSHKGQAVKCMDPQDPGPETCFFRGPQGGTNHVPVQWAQYAQLKDHFHTGLWLWVLCTMS